MNYPFQANDLLQQIHCSIEYTLHFRSLRQGKQNKDGT